MVNKASVVWQGGLKEGRGTVSTNSGALTETPYSFDARFAGGKGTTPEELIAAAHASCFTMAVAAELGKAGITPTKMETSALVTLEKQGEGFSITKSQLEIVATIPGADKAKFDAAVKAAETGCPVSKVLKAQISVKSTLNA
jgi:osmotically inducible protein OsmC